MSWLLRSFQTAEPDSSVRYSSVPSSPEHSTSSLAGVKQDLSDFGQTIGRQLRGVAAFLAPPPPPASSSTAPSVTPTATACEKLPFDSSIRSQKLLGIRNDLAEIGDSFKTGLSILSSNKAVTEISKFASNLLQLQNDQHEEEEEEEEEDDIYNEVYGVPGITVEIIDFIKEISMRPQCWTAFPLSVDNDFRMTNTQREHASTVERLVPSLATLRVNLQNYMGDEQFWIIYFILLLPRLDGHDFERLASLEVVETRDLLLQKLQNKMNAQADYNSLPMPQERCEITVTKIDSIHSVEKEMTNIVNGTKGLEINHKETTEQWSEEAGLDTSASADTQKKLKNEKDISFSDLEGSENEPFDNLRPAQGMRPSFSGSSDWVQLNEKVGQSKDSEGEELNDWLTVDDFDWKI